MQLTNNSGTITKVYLYDAFGVERDKDAEDSNPFRYCGEYYDKETGTIYLRARYYEPNNSHFLTKDTHWNINNMIYGDSPVEVNEKLIPNIFSITQSGNLYNYCMNNPLSFIDPLGEDSRWLTAEGSVPIDLLGMNLTTLGHTSAILQDGKGDWYYFYWGPDHALLEKVSDFRPEGYEWEVDAVGDIGNFNLWLEKSMNLGIDSKGNKINYVGTKKYTDSVYIKGDFTKSFEYYQELVDEYNSNGKGKNTNYANLKNNCMQQTYSGFIKGIFENKSSFTYASSINHQFPMTLNGAHKYMKNYFANSSFKKP